MISDTVNWLATDFMDIVTWIIGFALLAVAFVIGGFLGTWIKIILNGLGQAIPLNAPRYAVDLPLRALVVCAALIVCGRMGISLAEVVDTVLPVGNFDELAESFSSGNSSNIFSNGFSVAFNQIVWTIISFLPYFLITEVIGLTKNILCRPEEGMVYGFVSFIPELLTLMAANVFVLFLGDWLPRLLLDAIGTIKIEYGFFDLCSWDCCFLCICTMCCRIF